MIKAYDGYEALELLSTHEVNLMIVDVMMPGLDGIRTHIKGSGEQQHPDHHPVRPSPRIPIRSWDSISARDDYITKTLNRWNWWPE